MGFLQKIHFLSRYQKLVKIVEEFKLKDFDEIALIQENYRMIQSSEPLAECKTTSSKWHTILKSFNHISVNIFKIVSFVLSISETSAYCERIYSVMATRWRSEGNRCSVELLKNKLFYIL